MVPLIIALSRGHTGQIKRTVIMKGPDALAVCRALRGLPVGFLLLRYSV